jgi:hypothetical protein
MTMTGEIPRIAGLGSECCRCETGIGHGRSLTELPAPVFPG